MSNDYWERRQVQDAFHVFQKAEDLADQTANLYLKASRYLSFQADDVFEKYQTKHKLSDAEARRFVNTLQDRTSLDELLRKLKSSNSDESKKHLLAELEAPAYQARLERLRQLQNQLDVVMQSVYEQEKDFNTSFYTDLANESYYRGIYNIQQKANAAFGFNHVSAKMVDRVVNSRWEGANYSQRIWGNTKALSQDLKEELLINLITGRTNREVAAIISNKFGSGASKARRLIRTESNYVATEMNFEAYKECGIEKYQYLATLDLKTSLLCRGLDGKLFLVKERKTGINCPPMHPWCRSTTISVVDESLISTMQRSAIDPATGKRIKVPRTMNYEQWYDKYVRSNPKAVVEEKKIKNRTADTKQLGRYKEMHVNNLPDSLDKFQELKYNKASEWNKVHTEYLDKTLQGKIRSDAYNKTIEEGKQGKHIRGHNNYIDGRSYLTVDIKEAQEIVSKYAGTGKMIRDINNNWSHKELITVGKDIGVCVNQISAEKLLTDRAIIHYSKNGVHIVPANPREVK